MASTMRTVSNWDAILAEYGLLSKKGIPHHVDKVVQLEWCLGTVLGFSHLPTVKQPEIEKQAVQLLAKLEPPSGPKGGIPAPQLVQGLLALELLYATVNTARSLAKVLQASKGGEGVGEIMRCNGKLLDLPCLSSQAYCKANFQC